VLEIANSGLTGPEYSYALRAHFDFLVGEEDGTPRFAVEFDGPQHLTNPATRHRDRIKGRLCEQFRLPLLRIEANHLRRTGRFTVLGWLVEAWFVNRAWDAAQQSGDVSLHEPFMMSNFVKLAPDGEPYPAYDIGLHARESMLVACNGARVTRRPFPEVVQQLSDDLPASGQPADGYNRAYALLPLAAGGGLIARASCKATGFVPGCDGELIEGLVTANLGEKLRRYRNGELPADTDRDLARVRSATKGWTRMGDLLNDGPDPISVLRAGGNPFQPARLLRDRAPRTRW
jgi:Protein of unknown function (DUF2726)